MATKRIALEQLKIASPCTADWSKMRGNDQARFCDHCQQHVYNVAEMTRAQAEALIVKTEGNACMRLHRRHDGTVLTSDCAVGVQRISKGRWRVAGSALTATLSLLIAANVEARPRVTEKYLDSHSYTIIQSNDQAQSNDKPSKNGKIGKFTGTITSREGGVILGTTITLTNERTGEVITISTGEDGSYQHTELAPSLYTIKVFAEGFTPFNLEHLVLDSRAEITFNVSLDVNSSGVEGGAIVVSDVPDTAEQSGVMVLPQERSPAWDKLINANSDSKISIHGSRSEGSRNGDYSVANGTVMVTPQEIDEATNASKKIDDHIDLIHDLDDRLLLILGRGSILPPDLSKRADSLITLHPGVMNDGKKITDKSCSKKIVKKSVKK